MDDEHEHIMEYPAWREAISRLVRERRLEPEIVFDYAELYELFMIERPLPETPLGKAEKLKLQFLAQFKEFQAALLTEYQVALGNVRGIGYRIVPPADQTSWAEENGVGDMRKAIRKLSTRLTNVSLADLTIQDRRANADALARLGMLGGMLKQVREFKVIPPADEE